jgi:hypothetical protein
LIIDVTLRPLEVTMIERHPALRALTSRKSPTGTRLRVRRKVGAECAAEATTIETYGFIGSGELEGH